MVYKEHTAGLLTLGRSAEKGRCHVWHGQNHTSPLGVQKGAVGRAGGGEKFISNCELNLPTVKMCVSFTIRSFHKLTGKGRLCTLF